MDKSMKKQKDSAFLFYSNDFYEGTRTMFPEKRACLIDLMIYQHKHQLYNKETLLGTLSTKKI